MRAVGFDRRRRVHERTARAFRLEGCEQRRERDARGRNDDQRFRRRVESLDEPLFGEHGRRARRERAAEIARVDCECQRLRIGLLDRRDAANDDIPVADDAAAGDARKLRQRPKRVHLR